MDGFQVANDWMRLICIKAKIYGERMTPAKLMGIMTRDHPELDEPYDRALRFEKAWDVISRVGLEFAERGLGGDSISERHRMTLDDHREHLEFLDANPDVDDPIWCVDRAWTLEGIAVLENYPAGTTREQALQYDAHVRAWRTPRLVV